jgi:outer membrane receptor protein involved in Fe transport
LATVSTLTLSCAAQLLAAAPASAQADGDVEEVVVTSSRIVRSGFTAPTPTTSYDKVEMNLQAVTNPTDLLSQLPNFSPGGTLRTTGVTSNGGGRLSANLASRGGSTLILVDGRRFVSSSASGDVDLNQIPTLLTGRIEVVTGGASAAWGSDAVAGVVNLHIDTDVEGIRGTVQGGMSQHKDGIQGSASLAAGTRFAGDRGHFVIGGDYVGGGKVGDQYSRDWGREEWGRITNSAFATNGLPNFILAPNVHNVTTYSGSIVTAGPLKGTAFRPDGTPFQYEYGQVFGNSMIGGSGEGETTPIGSNLAAPVERGNVLAHVKYDLTDNVRVFAEASYAKTVVGGQSGQPRDQATLTIQRDNAYLPASVRAQMVALNLNTLTVGRQSLDFGFDGITNTTVTKRLVAGAEGDLPDGSFGANWGWDLYAMHGEGDYEDSLYPDRINPNWVRSIDAVVRPGTGQIVCRSTLADPGNGCIPTNIFGNGNAVPNAYTAGNYVTTNHVKQQVAAANFHGDPFSTWAGPVSIAVGAEYRLETARVESDANSQVQNANGTVGVWNQGNAQPFSGRYTVRELYAETVVPLATEVAWADLLEVNAAIRESRYSTSGSTVSWKLGVNYSPIEDLRLRVTRSRDMRAPNLQELFGPQQQGGITNIPNRNGVAQQVLRYSAGNVNLVPEIAATWTYGVAYRPSWAPRLNLSADYYDVRINNAISSVRQEQVAKFCFEGQTEYCQYINTDPNGNLISIVSRTLNLNSLEASGVDLEASYALPLSDLFSSWAGDLRIRYVGTYVAKSQTTAPASPPQNTISRHWRWNTSLTYTVGNLSVDLQGRYIGKGLYDNQFTTGAGAANTINDNTVSPYFYLNLGVDYALINRGGRNLHLFGRIENLLDTDPPMIPSGSLGGTSATSTNTGLYDAIGRYFKVGLRFEY